MAKPIHFPGPHEPVHIFQDDFFERQAPMTCHAPMPAITKPARRPLSSSSSNVILNPPYASHANYSPHKTNSSSPRSPLKSSNGSKLNMVSMAPPMGKGPTTDSLQKRPHLSKFKTAAAQRSASAPSIHFGKENVHPQIFPAPPTINLSLENYYQKPNGKRGLMDAAPIKDARSAKKTKTDDATLPPHDSFPPTQDDGTKPPHSYAQLIGMAILRSPLRRLTLAQIYKWISDNYSFYNPNDAGWQNSIRHNLSLHKNFIKIERPKDDPGKGNYWGIEPGTEFQFLKEKPSRKPATAPVQEPTLPPPAPMHHCSLPPLPTSQATMSMPLELSSDATIPISDNAPHDEPADKSAEHELPVESSLYSPLPANMHSSPPVSRNLERRSGTPPSAARNPGSSATRSHKRRFASMDDSGYISSLESSVMRPNQKALLLTSEADRPRIKRGRAEEEIARLRGSSPFSPTKSRSLSTYGPVSSSPLRQANEHQMLPPLTPVIKMKPPVRPPPSASPNTNLRIHRDKVRNMLQSPLRRVTGVGEDCIPWSPAFNLDDALYAFDDAATTTTDFDIFQDMTSVDDTMFPGMNPLDTGSPIKRSAKRARWDRSVSTSALTDITNSGKKKPAAYVPLLKFAEQSPSQFLETPSKAFEGLGSPSKLFGESPLRNPSPSRFMLDLPGDGDWPSLAMDPNDFMSHDVSGGSDFSGLDILQGFEKIGSNAPAFKQPKIPKPAMGRSYTTRF
ncbi:forkhead domain-containing protein [Hirsutella rhossiliensis]|uniref:Forkhead domain-containing protein n=1 Tax=Hirsutella rhossiliensis TaxID=111463 RepID=A0A9P8MXM3_9HYPO|nr:forkhead domain-containing protein [Hirsutella rhossiliensis]KAH0963054.1 forkhead domain-containing protein [Hirsutella rhossiliensis]